MLFNFRYQRKLDRDEVQDKHHVARALIELQSESPEIHEIFTAVPLASDSHKAFTALPLASESPSKPPNISVESELPESPSTPQVTQSQVDSEIQRLISENMQLKAELQAHQLSKKSFEHDNEKVKYYTGLPRPYDSAQHSNYIHLYKKYRLGDI
ncbi:hypothetical protein DPMN_071767 [Dreissena polymorpha]|uniref:Uncharacterized protein n=1 Tax=Dreissena polymorpha TaxID=45954 RepID=A0A9D3Z2W9_DREPO|nr:hypothetical protein DPMN_071767 [Dreissena polymorpha]